VVTRQRLLIAAGVAVAAVAVAVLVTQLTGGTHVVVPAAPVEGTTQMSRSGTLFGDRVRASVSVIVDRKRVDPSRVGFTTHFDPFITLGSRVSRHDTGRLTSLVYSADLICLTNLCLSKGNPEPIQVRFPPAQVFYPAPSGGRRTLRLPWQATTIGPRTTVEDLNGADPFEQPSWRATTAPFPVTYSTSPHTLRLVLFLVSGLLFALALFALARFVLKALELLSHELGRSGEPDLALVAKQLAWAEPTPLPTLTQPLTLDVRKVIEQRSNGHA
jgi:hypothetical protein